MVVAALALAAASGQRHDGQTVTGNAQGARRVRTRPAIAGRRLERQIKDHPDDPAAHLVYARFLLETGRTGPRR